MFAKRSFVVLLFTLLAAVSVADDPDVGKGMVELVTERGFPIEEHYVITEDGYILGMFRIPHGRAGPSPATRPAVLLQHGLLDSSYTWINNFQNESLAYILADNGFDVWLGNNRGNTFSRRHVSLSPKSEAFWDFTYDQMAQYDMPAEVDYVRNATGQSKIVYMGHSEGTTQAFAALGMDSTGSLNVKAAAGISEKLSLFVALAPVGSVEHQKSGLLTVIADLVELFDLTKLFEVFGMKQFLPSATLLQSLAPWLCNVTPNGCNDVLFLLCGGPSHNLNNSRIEVYVSETPAGTSVKNMGHWVQNVKAKRFQMFDYGCGLFSCENMNVYGQRTAPAYDVSKISVPTMLVSGGEDDLADPTDVAWLHRQLPASQLVEPFQEPSYTHLDFVWAEDAHTLIYPQVVNQAKKFATVSPGMSN